MKLSRPAWNNVIIFSVMIIILLINTTNNRLFPEDENSSDALILPEHSVILALEVTFPDASSLMFERVGRAWKMTSQGRIIDLTNQQIEQVMFAWQQSSGLVQATDIIIDSNKGTQVAISLAGIEQEQKFTLYPLTDQLLLFNHQKQIWLALPSALSRQLTPTT
ncbi:MAG: hypothetical protein OQK09_05680 [Colwellia sp.]|nr:hypothetical protein [Colwellia sp.]MCW8864855.1 hypothetical protein [Colwellia sp.]MCW9080984.1 hypothetical protein [Colwellia sp.]